MAQKFRVNVPVADLRSKPDTVFQSDFSHQAERESQLLFNEPLALVEEKEEWLYVLALDQFRFAPKKSWHPYPGWVHRSEVRQEKEHKSLSYVVTNPNIHSYGTYLFEPEAGSRTIPKVPNRKQLVEEARLFVDLHYLWGGRSHCPSPESRISSVDCSGLVDLLYRAQGILIPRNAHDQYLASRPTKIPLPGDPIYLTHNKLITHVMIKLDADFYIESPETGKKVRILKWGKDLWEQGGKIYFIDKPGFYTPFPRTFFRNPG